MRNLANAAAFAAARGQNINSLLTVVWRLQRGWERGLRGTARDAWEKAHWPGRQRLLLDMTGRWLHHRGVALVAVWDRERCEGRGAHSHIGIALPPDRAVQLGDELRDYLAKAFDFHAEGDQPGVHVRHADDPADGDLWPVRYLCRSLTPGFRYAGAEREDYHVALGLKRKDGGKIGIQRCGVSRSIDSAARHAAGRRDVRDLEGVRRLLHPGASAL